MPRASKPRLPKGQKLSEDPNYEDRIQSAIEGVASGKYKNLQVASRAENVAYTTLRDRAQGKHRNSQAFHATCRLLTPEEETMIIDQAKLLGESGEPWSRSDLRAMITKLTGKEVGKCYVDRFLNSHRDRLKLAKSSKRAKN